MGTVLSCAGLSLKIQSQFLGVLLVEQPIVFAGIFFFFQAEDGIRDFHVTGVQTCALPISRWPLRMRVSKSPRGSVTAISNGPYQLDLVTPGIRPLLARSRSMTRARRNLR